MTCVICGDQPRGDILGDPVCSVQCANTVVTNQEEKIQHTDALQLCSDLKGLQHQTAALYHELVLHYCATGVPSHKTEGGINSLRRQMERVQEQLDVIESELARLDR